MAAGWKRLGGRALCCWAGERCAAGWEGQDCWEGEMWTPRWEFCAAGQEKGCAPRRESAGLLGGREVGCWVGETRRESAVLLGRREVDDGCAAGWEVRRERDG